ncbi:MAG: DUF3990 domain-containing protein, partial [Anaerovoracaceae bacterium]
GKGFYLTTIESQANKWAENIFLRYGGEGAFLNKYELQQLEEYRTKEFREMSLEWLEFVKDNRLNGGTSHDYDIVVGPVANDVTVRTITLYVNEVIDAESAIRQLKYNKASNQISIHTIEALNSLKLIEKKKLF